LKCVRSIAGSLLSILLVTARAETPPPGSLADLSLEELARIEVTSVSRHAEPLSSAPASIFVITGDDIRRSGATTLPEALRLAPNLQVARLDAGQYAISARGFNNAIGNKLLVLIDGRTVYAPFFSGVQWDQQDVMLDDVDRIEVISGPGGTLWGTNAVNGVINVVTRNAARTQGVLAVAEGGDPDLGAALRYGAPIFGGGHVRVFAKAMRLENTRTADDIALADGWDRVQGGLRADWTDDDGGLSLQGNVFRARAEHRGFIGPFEQTPIEISQSNVLGLWTRRFASGADVRVQMYYNRSDRGDTFLYQPTESVLDFEFQNGLPFDAHRVLWGGGYRRSRDDIRPGFFFGFVPQSTTSEWANLFVQDTIKLGERIDVTIGSRFERNPFTGTEVLPSARGAWRFIDDHMLWAAASRAVRAPARLDRDLRLPPNPPFLIAGGPNFESEVANVYELGYRGQPARDVSVSITAFYQDWDKLRSGQLPPNAQVQNMIFGHTSGVEAWFAWQPLPRWRLSGGVTTLHKNLRLRPGSADPVGATNLGNDPDYQWMLRSAFDVTERQGLDVLVRRVAALPDPSVPAYTAVDLRYGWRAAPALELALIVRNALDPAHPEFNGVPGRSEIERSVLVQVRWAQ
jgi:iron complex outermembrane receptor protein